MHFGREGRVRPSGRDELRVLEPDFREALTPEREDDAFPVRPLDACRHRACPSSPSSATTISRAWVDGSTPGGVPGVGNHVGQYGRNVLYGWAGR